MKIKLSEIFTFEVIENEDSIFNVMQDEVNYPLVKDFITADNVFTLNYDYFVGYSANKYISPLLKRMIDEYADYVYRITKIIYNRFANKWKKIYDALMTQYNALENYSMLETRTPNLTTNETTNEDTDINVNRKTNASSSYKGFNADNPVTINSTDGEEDTTTTGAKADNEVTKETKQTGTETLTRSGNIGVTTSQQMLESEFKVRQYDFYKMIYNDIDSVLCLSIY